VLPRSSLAISVSQRREVLSKDGDPDIRQDTQEEFAFRFVEQGTERIVSVDHRLQSRLKRRQIGMPCDVQGQRHMIGVVAGMQAVEEPQLTLTECRGKTIRTPGHL
jgi:hypothetical protein